MKQCLKKNEEKMKEMRDHPKDILEVIKVGNNKSGTRGSNGRSNVFCKGESCGVCERKKVHADKTYIWPKASNADRRSGAT